MRIAEHWEDYEILDASGGEKLERWGSFTLVRPDPQVIWNTERTDAGWSSYDGRYIRSTSGGGHWESRRLPESWDIRYRSLRFRLKPMGFKHTGLFPEQAVNWNWMGQKLAAAKAAGRPCRVLNLFAYTGGATVACAAAGAQVVHCDAAKGMVLWAKENAALCGLRDAPVRYIVDDCIKFVEREGRRGNRYDAILMDPPSYGRGPGGEVWKLEEQIDPLLRLCGGLLSDTPLFFLLNSYTTGLSPSVMGYLLGVSLQNAVPGRQARITADEIGLRVASTGLTLPCGATAIAEFT